MAKRTFAINTEPHEADIAGVTYLFQPEVSGAVFVGRYTGMRDLQAELTATGDESAIAPEDVLKTYAAMRDFVASFMLPESAKTFQSADVPERIYGEIIEWISELYGGGSGK